MTASARVGCSKPMPFQRSYLWSSPSLSCTRSVSRGLRVSRMTTAASARTAGTPQQLVLAVVRLSSEPTPLFRLRFFGRWRGGFLLSRSGSFGLWLFSRGLLGFRRCLLGFRLWLFAFRLLFLLRFFLGDICVHPLDKCHTRRIALPRSEFDDSGVTAVPFSGTLRDVVEQFFHD